MLVTDAWIIRESAISTRNFKSYLVPSGNWVVVHSTPSTRLLADIRPLSFSVYVCTLYYTDETENPSWAHRSLTLLIDVCISAPAFGMPGVSIHIARRHDETEIAQGQQSTTSSTTERGANVDPVWVSKVRGIRCVWNDSGQQSRRHAERSLSPNFCGKLPCWHCPVKITYKSLVPEISRVV